MQVRELGLLAAVAGAVTACTSDEHAVIVAERARFRELAPEQYVIAACGTGMRPACTREVVIGGRVVTAEVTAAVTAEVAGPSELTWRPVVELDSWVDQVSSMFESAIAGTGSLRTLEFEPRWHYVSEYLDADDQAGRRVTCFLPDRVDLQQCQAAGSGLTAF